MSCEEAERQFTETLNAKTRLFQELEQLMPSILSTPGQRGVPTMPSSEQVQRVDRLWKEYRLAEERHGSAVAALIEAQKRHRD